MLGAGNAHKIHFPLFFPISDQIANIQILIRGQEYLSTYIHTMCVKYACIYVYKMITSSKSPFSDHRAGHARVQRLEQQTLLLASK